MFWLGRTIVEAATTLLMGSRSPLRLTPAWNVGSGSWIQTRTRLHVRASCIPRERAIRGNFGSVPIVEGLKESNQALTGLAFDQLDLHRIHQRFRQRIIAGGYDLTDLIQVHRRMLHSTGRRQVH